jgi:DNA-binding SARP family transcriptional activator/tetratricopeptide (TPR) repeat protein
VVVADKEGRCVEFRVLGPLEVRAGDGPLSLGPRKQRALLALLLLHANRVVARERLVDGLWGESPPETAVASVQVYVSRLRKSLPEGVLLTRPPGYVFEVEPEEFDLLRFERLVAAARAADVAHAAVLLREALGLWRGAPLAEFSAEPFARVEAGRLEELRLVALEDRIEADLSLGRDGELVGELAALVASHPRRERLCGQLMLALYRSGRQSDALDAYRAARAALAELGLEPGAGLRGLERRILTQDAGLELGRPLVAGPVPLPGALVPESPFPFVGRVRELATVRELLRRADGGEGGVVLLAGEAGGGKTRLVRELAREGAAGGALVLYGTSDATITTPYQPVREWLEFLLRVEDRRALVECFGSGGGELVRLVPKLAQVTGAAVPERRDAESDRFALQSAVVELLTGLGRRQPLLLVADDLHWADGETLHLLRRLGSTAPEDRWLLVAAYRSEESEGELIDTLADLGRRAGVTRLTLGNLDHADVGEFVRLSTEAEATPELVSALGELTDGTPLLLCELWRDLSEGGGVEVTDAVRLTRPAAELRGPDPVRELVRQRLSRLDPGTVDLLELSAAAGPRFELRLLAKAAGVDPAALAGPAGEAVRSGLVERFPEPAHAHRFTHELVRRAVYDRITDLHRAELHLRLGEALERAHAADPVAILPELAHHFTLAAPLAGVERAIVYNLRAAEAATAAAAHGEAADRFAAALGLGIDDPGDRVRVQVALARALRQTARNAEAAALFSDAYVAATMLGERGLAARALVGSSELRLNSDPDVGAAEIVPIVEAAIRALRELDDELGLAQAERLLGVALDRDGREQAAVAAFERALVHAEAAGDRYARRFTVRSLAENYWRRATRVEDAIVRLEQLRAASRDDRLLEAVVGCCLAYVIAMAGRFDEARALVDASAPIVEAADEFGTSTILWGIPEMRELAGDVAGAEQDWLAIWTKLRTERGQYRSWGLRVAAALALLYVDQERWDDACACLSYGEERSDLPYGTVYPPTPGKDYSFLRLAAQARVAAHLGDTTTALELARRALDSAERHRPRALLALAEVERAAGHAAEADAAVARALELYEQKGNVAAAARLRERFPSQARAEPATRGPASRRRPSRSGSRRRSSAR